MGLRSLASAASFGNRTSELTMSESLRNFFHKSKLHQDESSTIKVLVSLKSSPNEKCLAGLRDVGLSVKSVEGNKLIGEIDSTQLTKLQEHIDVREVERSVMLKPTLRNKE